MPTSVLFPASWSGSTKSIIIMAMAIFFSARLGVNALVVGFCLYILVSTVITGVQARRYFLPSGTNPLRSPHIHSLLTMIGPLLIGYGAIYVNQIVDKILISGLESGAVTAVGYASTLTDLISTLIASLCTVLYSHMAEAIAQGKTEAAAHLIQRSVLILTLILLPVTIITVCQAEDIISFALWTGSVWRGGDPNVGSSPVWLRLCIYPDGLEGDLRPGTIWIPELPAANPQQYRRDSCKHCAEYSALPPIRRTRSYPCQQCCYSGDGSAQHGYSPAMYAGAFYDSTISDTTIFMCRRGDICIPLH